MVQLAVKICGLSTPESVDAAQHAGARYIGLVFFPPSPRAVTAALAAQLVRRLRTGTRAVGLFVNPSDADLEAVIPYVPLDLLQLHGQEPPERVREIKARFPLPVIKAIPLAEPEDLAAVPSYLNSADMLLFDAKLPKSVSALPGGNGIPFDWHLLAGHDWPLPWLLSGGLTPDNLTDAVQLSGATIVDVSSGVEDRPGHKSIAAIDRFLEASRDVG